MKKIYTAVIILSLILLGIGVYFGTLMNYGVSVDEKDGDCVFLIHGLARSSSAMGQMERFLHEKGYETINIDYPSIKYDIQTLTEDFIAPAIETHCQVPDKKMHFVTHSLGGILIRNYLNENEPGRLGRVVMIAPPNHGSEMADRLMKKWFYRFITGPVLSELGTNPESIPLTLPDPNFEFGVIGGTLDGKVSLDSAANEAMSDFLKVERRHTFIQNAPEVKEGVARFIETGEF
ncbi:alpha/beta hydrolase [Candidatus Peregrinibacteria bacterium]|jgi:triacylglycerol lipase|nr:alpha/beta hydrolase [Candidatus Peregrinibacteria bacterium]